MIKARAGDHIFFGLSDENMRRLKEGKPIKVDLTELGLVGTAIIFNGETEESMRADLSEFVGPDTKYRDDTKGSH